MGDFASTLKRIRLDRKMSQQEMAEFLHTSKQNISGYELGEVTPKISSFAEMAKRLGVSLSELNGEESTDIPPARNCSYNSKREKVLRCLNDLSEDDLDKLLDFAQFLLTREKTDPDHQK